MSKTQNSVAAIATVVILAALTGVIWWYTSWQQTASTTEINSFEACAAKYPVMESYPERCTVPGGKTFTKQY